MGIEKGGGISPEALEAMVQWVEAQGQKIKSDLTFQEFFQWVNRGHAISERSFRRLIKSLGLCKNERGYYCQAHVIVVFTWIRRRERFYSCEEFMDRVGQQVYKDAHRVDFTLFEKFGGIQNVG